ncbi:MAG TPA: SBBP repeat-containing protein [bacterium]|nr:SBBP repeat-containing protein [bacterium]
MRIIRHTACIMTLAFLILSGCGRNSGNTADTDQAVADTDTVVIDDTATDELLTDDDVAATDEPLLPDDMPPTTCGNGITDAGERCDDGAINGTNGHCTTSCTAIVSRTTRLWGTHPYTWSTFIDIDADGNMLIMGYLCLQTAGRYIQEECDYFLTKWHADGTQAWTVQGGTIPNYYYPVDAAVDSSGNIYVAGNRVFLGSNNVRASDLFLSKYSPEGALLWTKEWGTAFDDYLAAVEIGISGDIFMAGYTSGGLDGNTAAGKNDLFLTRWEPDGAKVWTRQWGTSEDDFGGSLVTDATGNIFVAGYTYGALDGNILTGESDLFLSKWSPDGTKEWTKQWGTDVADFGGTLAADTAGNVFVTGVTLGALDGDLLAGKSDPVLTKWDSDGNKKWTRQWGTNDREGGGPIAVDAFGNILVLGSTPESLDGNAAVGENDMFLTKWNTDGTKLWSSQWGSIYSDAAHAMDTDTNGTIYVVGETQEAIDGAVFSGETAAFLSIIHEN